MKELIIDIKKGLSYKDLIYNHATYFLCHFMSFEKLYNMYNP